MSDGKEAVDQLPEEIVEVKSETVKIAFFSGIDFKSAGYREGLVELACDISRQEGVNFIVSAGGLISQEALKDMVPKKKEDQQEFIAGLARDFAMVLPRIPRSIQNGPANEGNSNTTNNRNGESNGFVRTYIVTSKAYDGWVGDLVAKTLVKEMRKDIRYWGQGHVTFWIRESNGNLRKRFRVLVPEKKPWKSDFYSTPAQRIVRDDYYRTHVPFQIEECDGESWSRQATSRDAVFDLYVCGCLASSFIKPAMGEVRTPIIAVPDLHKLEHVVTSENQEGIRIVEISPQYGMKVRTYNFKDLVGREREFVRVRTSNDVQRKIVGAIRARGPLTAGLLANATNVSRDVVNGELEALLKMRSGIEFDEYSERYDFRSDLIKNVKYPWPKDKDMREDTIVAFGCLHAGYKFCDVEFFVNRVPEFIERQKATVLVGAGDFIGGLKHDLLTRGEIYGGLNITQQERLAAYLTGEVILRVFRSRFENAWNPLSESSDQKDEKTLRNLVESALITFVYIEGNHDMWQRNQGITPLSEFRHTLVQYLVKNIERILHSRGVVLGGLEDTIEGKVMHAKRIALPSGLFLEVYHPHNARLKTMSGRLQELFDKSSAHIVIGANWHVALGIEHWDPVFGQRVGLQVPTVVTTTEFEESKNKVTDFGVGSVRVKSHKGKIYMSEFTFFGEPSKDVLFDNENILRDLLRKLGIQDAKKGS